MMKKWVVMLFSILLLIFISLTAQAHSSNVENEEEIQPHTVTVVLERVYLDGETSKEYVVEPIWSMEDFWAKYADWQLIDMNELEITFRQEVDDISPLLKANGYFGVTKDGNLSIFNGQPEQSNIIHTFFQIDMEKLESKKHEELKKGIPIRDKDHFVEVLETFKSIQKEETE